MGTLSEKQSNREYWQGHVERAREYGGTDVEYCAEHGLKVVSFYSWKRRILGKGKEPRRKEASFSKVSLVSPKRSQPLPDAKWLSEFLKAWAN